MRKHAICSASSAERWINCPPSARLNAEAEDRVSEFALQGTDAHELCEYLVKTAIGQHIRDPTVHLKYYDQEMQEAAEGYRDFVMEHIEEMTSSAPPFVSVEQSVRFNRWVPEGFGTCDCMIVNDGMIDIIDFKYGTGVEVSAEQNSQLMCYALGAMDLMDGMYDVQKIRLNIYQPRKCNVSSWELTAEALLSWANETLRPAAQAAFEGTGDYKAGGHCRFCRIKAACRTYAAYYTDLLKYEFREPSKLTGKEITEILGKLDGLISWSESVKDYALKKALGGTKYDGYKVVAGRSIRKYTDETAVARAVESEGLNPYRRTLLTITEMQKMLGKKRFESLLSRYVIKPEGRPVLVPESDKRPPLETVSARDFDET